MLEGLRKDNGERVKLWAMDAPSIGSLVAEIEENREIITCHNPNCGCSMYVRAADSKTIVTHFARFPKTGNEQSHPGKGESLEHQLAKQRLALWLQQSYPTAEITTEFSIEDQRVDVYVKHADGHTEAHEIQRTPQTCFRTQSRTDGYKAKGIANVVWWWLDQGDEERSREWCVSNADQYGTGKSVYEEIMGHKILTDIKFTRFNCDDIKLDRKRKYDERMKRLEEQAESRQPKRSYAQPAVSPIVTVPERNPIVGQTYPTQFRGGYVRIVAYNPATDRYTGESGLTWQLVEGVMVTPEECKL